MPESRYAKRPDWISLGVVLGHALLVLGPVYLATMIPLWGLPLCWLAFGFLMNGLLNLMHEAAHYHVFRRRASNDLLGRWFLGPLAAADFDAYRQRHWDHHRHLGAPEDPKVTYHEDIRRRRMLSSILRCLLLVEALRKFRHQRSLGDDEPAPGSSPRWFLRTLVMQAAFMGSLFGVAYLVHDHDFRRAIMRSATAYLAVYIYGLGSLTVLAANIRAIAEHQIDTAEEAHEGTAALRNFSCNLFTRLCFGAYGFGEHATHHHQPAIPYYHLRERTAALAQQDARLAPTHGYLRTVHALVCRATPSSSVVDPHPVNAPPS